MKRSNTKYSTLSLAIALGLSSPLAFAQDANDDTATQEAESGEATTLNAITVTARRREEALKDVPVAVTALDHQRLEDTGAKDLTALQQQTPNATVQVARGSNSTLISFIRGVGQQDPLWGFEPGVGLYVDDVYIARPQGALLDVYDIERIEVLRGPQGTLYGRNTIGGAIKYVSRRLGGTPRFEGKLSVGSYDQLDGVANFALPVGDTFSIGGAVASFNRDGFGKNLTTGAEHYDRDTNAYRFSAEWSPNDSLFARLAYDKQVDKSNARHGHRLVAGAMPDSQILPDVFDTTAGGGDDLRVETEGWSLSVDYTINDSFTLRSITARREGSTGFNVIDFDSTPTKTLDIPNYYADDQTSQELQLLFEGERAQGVFGLYYLDAHAEGAFDTVLALLGLTIGNGGYTDTKSYSAFGDVSFDINDRTRLSVGGRYTRDDRTGHVHRATYLGTDPTPQTGGAPATPLITNTFYTNSRDFSQFTPRVSLSRDFGDNLTGYASYSQGFKSGGFDMRGDALAAPMTVDGYDPEEVDTFELGLKGSALDGRLHFSSAVFYSDYTGQQVTVQALVPGLNTIASVVANAGASTIYGAEFEASVQLNKNFRAFTSLGYINAEFDEFLIYDANVGGTVNIANTAGFQNTPEFTGFIGATWTIPAFGGSIAVTPTVSYRAKTQMFEFSNAILDQGAYTLVDLNATWTASNGKWSVGVAGRNLTDEEYRVGGYNFPGAAFDNSIVGFYGPPRTWTATLTYRY
ncbi:MAG TPA: TonB-dependent receptor [Luteimonas sp.]|nr:TonB-dependent receptor [Luteimonas sp.]